MKYLQTEHKVDQMHLRDGGGVRRWEVDGGWWVVKYTTTTMATHL